ncbi:MAG: hypothetical protein WAP23_00040 [Candidatus Spechtbacterales bacterium]
MKKSTRTFLFFLFAILFLAITPAVVGYSQGYRVDWQNIAIVQTGALFLEPRPAPVEVYLNSEFIKRSSFVFQNIFLGNLLPKNYRVEIKKEGYSPWQKNLAVSPKLVSEAKNITLFPLPDTNKINKISSNLKNFFPSPSGKDFIFLKNTPVPEMSLYSLNDQREILALNAPSDFAGYTIGDIQWNRDSSNIIFPLEMGSRKKWIFADPASATLKSVDLSQGIMASENFKKLTKKLYRPTIDDLRWNPNNPREIFFIASDNSTERLLFSYNIGNAALSKPLAYDVLGYSPEKDKILYVSSTLYGINSLDLNTGQINQVSLEPVSQSAMSADITFITTQKDIYSIYRLDKDLYILNPKNWSLEKISTDVEKTIVADDHKKILLVKKNELAVYWLEDIRTQPFRAAGDYEQIINTDEQTIGDAVWFSKNNEYVVFSMGDSINATELDGRDNRNTSVLVSSTAKKIFREGKNEVIYFLDNDTMYSLSLKYK